MPRRDGDFNPAVVLQLGMRVNHLCSKCRAQTRGPNEDDEKSTNLGKASHIHAASPGGARYDEDQSEEDRVSINNGIWMCATCADLIDKDWKRFPASLLYRMKAEAEHEARTKLGVPPPAPMPPPPPSDDLGNLRLLLHEVEHVRDQSKADAVSWSSAGQPPRKYDYKPIHNAVQRVPTVLTETNFVAHLKSLRESIDAIGGRGGSIKGAEFPNLLKNISNYGDHTHAALTALIKRLQTPAAPVAVVQVAPSLPEPVARTRNLKIALKSEPVTDAPPERDTVRHRMVISATNTSNVRIQDWLIDVEFPARLLVPGFPYENMVKERTTKDRAFFRFNMSHQALYPGDTQSVDIIYRIEQWLRSQPRCIPALFVTSHVNGVRDSGGGGCVPDLPGVLWKIK